MAQCEKCVADKSFCEKCITNPVYQEILAKLPKRSYYADYIPVCPRGYDDCVNDPAYIQYHHPEWYKEVYGDVPPAEAIYFETDCWDRFVKDPDEKYYCYDDEDK